MAGAGLSGARMSTLRNNLLVRLVDEITRTQGRIKHLFSEVRYESGLGPTERLVLAAILEADTPPTVPQIGRSLGHPRQVIQRAVNSREEAGYVDKLDNPDHKRAPLLAATGAGTSLKRQTDRLALEVADAFIADFDKDALGRLVGDLHRFRQAIEKHLRERENEGATNAQK